MSWLTFPRFSWAQDSHSRGSRVRDLDYRPPSKLWQCIFVKSPHPHPHPHPTASPFPYITRSSEWHKNIIFPPFPPSMFFRNPNLSLFFPMDQLEKPLVWLTSTQQKEAASHYLPLCSAKPETLITSVI